MKALRTAPLRRASTFAMAGRPVLGFGLETEPLTRPAPAGEDAGAGHPPRFLGSDGPHRGPEIGLPQGGEGLEFLGFDAFGIVGHIRSGEHFAGVFCEPQMAFLYRLRSLESDLIGLYELMPDDELLAKAGCESLKSSRQLG